MNFTRIMLAAVTILLVSGAGVWTHADLTPIDQPRELTIDRPIFREKQVFYAIPDFTISEVVKEFLYTSSYGSYYRYYVTVENYGGFCSDCPIKLSAVSRYSYPDHGSDIVSDYDIFTAPNWDQSVVATFVVNEEKLSGYEYPDLFVVTFTVDADEDYRELDEENNTWSCDDVIGPCDTCVGDDCP